MYSAILFSEDYAQHNLGIESKLKTLYLLVSDIDVLLWKWPPLCLKWPPTWQIQWHDVYGNTFSEVYAPKNLDIVDIEGCTYLSFLDRGITLEMAAMFLNGLQNGGYNGLLYSAILFFSEICAPENLYIASTMMALRLLVSEIWWHSGHFKNGCHRPHRGNLAWH